MELADERARHEEELYALKLRLDATVRQMKDEVAAHRGKGQAASSQLASLRDRYRTKLAAHEAELAALRTRQIGHRSAAAVRKELARPAGVMSIEAHFELVNPQLTQLRARRVS